MKTLTAASLALALAISGAAFSINPAHANMGGKEFSNPSSVTGFGQESSYYSGGTKGGISSGDMGSGRAKSESESEKGNISNGDLGSGR